MSVRIAARRASIARTSLFVILLALVHVAPDSVKAVVSRQTNEPANTSHAATPLRLADGVRVVDAAERGAPWISYKDGVEFPQTVLEGNGSAALKTGSLAPAALASADLDEDGVPDLVSSFSGSDGGAVMTMRGNLRSIYPHAPLPAGTEDLGDAPFLGRGSVVPTAARGDLLGTGDVTADGHADVVIAAKGSSSFSVLPGDGKGGFGLPTVVKVDGAISAMAVGEIDRPDGQADVVVGVGTGNGARALLFASKAGGVKKDPEVVKLAGTPRSIAIGFVAVRESFGVAIAAGRSLTVVHGATRKGRTVDTRSLDTVATSVALGSFTRSGTAEIAVAGTDGTLRIVDAAAPRSAAWVATTVASDTIGKNAQLATAMASSRIGDDLVVVDGSSPKIGVLEATAGEPEAAWLDVDSAPVAILPMRLNSDGMDDFVVLRRGSSRPSFVMSTPRVMFTVMNANPGGPGSLDDAIALANSSSGPDMIDFNIVGPAQIAPVMGLNISETLTIDGTTQSGYMGTPVVTVTGQTASGDGFTYVSVSNGSVLRGLDIVSWSGSGVYMPGGSQATTVEACHIGVDPSGTADQGNGADGVRISDSSDNVIGGTVASARNIISGNGAQGVHLTGASTTNNNQIFGNYIGTDVTGQSSISNHFNGVEIMDASTTSVGGNQAGSGNVISGNTEAGNLSNGVYSHGVAFSNSIAGNLIGLAADGSTDLGNGFHGILCADMFVGIGGASPSARNVISGNGFDGVIFAGSSNDGSVSGNFIGTDSSGMSAVGNAQAGVEITGGDFISIDNGCVISGNTYGILVANNAIAANINGNFIGVGSDGATALPNTQSGVVLALSTQFASVTNNTIAFNGDAGVDVPDAANSVIGGNNIYSNGALGIDLGADGVTPNDGLGDADSGANGLLNFPVLTSVGTGATFTATGTYAGMVSSDFIIDFFRNDSCDGSGNGEGQNYIGSIQISTNSIGSAAINADFAPQVPVSPGDSITSTATLLSTGGRGKLRTGGAPDTTSEFSACVVVPGAPGPDLAVSMSAMPDPVSQSQDVTYSISLTNAGKPGADMATLTGTTPAGTTFDFVNTPAGWSAMTPPVGGTGTITFTNPVMSPGTDNFTIVLRINASVPDNTDVTFSVTASQTAMESNTSNNTDMATVTVAGSPSWDLGVSVEGSPDLVTAGGNATFSITVTNNGPFDAFGIALTTDIPANTTFVSFSTNPGWSCEAPPVGGTGSIMCSAQGLPDGESVTFDLVVKIDDGASPGTVITDTAEIASMGDPNSSNDIDSDNVTVATPNSADLAVVATASPTPSEPGATLTFQIEVTNVGPTAATDVALTAVLPDEVTFTSATASTGGSITPPSGSSGGSVSCVWSGSTAVGYTQVLTIVTTVSTSLTEDTTVVLTANATSASPDPDTSNNSTNTTASIVVDESMPRADVQLTSTGGTGDLITGDYVTYQMTVHNAGPDAADDVTVSGATPSGTRLVSITTTQGTVSGPPEGGSGSYDVNIGTIDPNGTVSVALTVNILARGGTTLENSATVSSSTVDPVAANNSVSTSGTVVAGNDTLLTWDPPLSCDDDCLNPPLHLQTQSPTKALLQAGGGDKLRNSLVGYNIYRSNQPTVQTTPANLFTSVSPSTTQLIASTAPSGSFFTVTAVYPNGESGATNAASGGLPEPTIASVQFKNGKMIVNGTDFAANVTVFVDGIPFVKPAKIKTPGVKIVQKGKLLTQQTVANYITGQGGVVLVSVLNGADDGIGTFLYRR